MLCRLGVVGLVLTLAIGCASAQELYRLQVSDRIEIWTSVETSLQRTATIGPDGWLSLPLIGHVKAAGVTAQELEVLLKERLSGFFKGAVDLTVMLQPGEERAQTIYVTGEVATPGAYPFRPGMILLHGVSMAGGLRVDAAGAGSEEQRIVETRGRIVRDTARLDALEAQVTRITAELAGEELRVDDAPDAPSIERERQILAARRAEEAAILQARDDALALLGRAVEATRQQAETHRDRIDIAEKRLAAVSKLVSKGYVSEARRLELAGELAELHAREHEIQVDLLEAEREASAEAARSDAVLKERRTGLEIELREAERGHADVAAQINEGNRILEIIVAGASAATVEEPAEPPKFSIIRSADGRPVELDATEFSGIEPGDLIRVGPRRQMAPDYVSSIEASDTASRNAALQ